MAFSTTAASWCPATAAAAVSNMPMMGLGTLGVEPDKAAATIRSAIQAGYRRFDCAPVYFNEVAIGDALTDVMNEGIVQREDLYIVSKLPSPFHRHVKQALQKTLTDLNLTYLDLYLIHWPVAFHYVEMDPNTRGWPDESIDDSDNGNNIDTSVSIHDTWRAMEELLETGVVKAIGVSNFPVILLHELLSNAKVPPAVNQCEAHPYLQNEKLLQYCSKRGIHLQAYSTLGTPGYKESGEPDILNDPVLQKVAAKYQNASTAQVCLAWAMQRGTSVVAKSVTEQHQNDNFASMLLHLSQEDMEEIAQLERNYRFFRPEDWWGDLAMAVFN